MNPRTRDPLDLVSLRQLRYFVAAMRARSFKQAAGDCSISQSALSDQIAALEAVLEVRLFDRSGGRAVPTRPAQELHQRLTSGLVELQSALHNIHENSGAVGGLVRVGLVQSYGACWVAPAVHEAQAQWPALAAVLRRRTASALTEGILRGDLDLAATFDPEPHADLEIAPCFTEPFVAVGGLPGRSRTATLERLAGSRLALLPAEYAMRRQLDAAFASAGLKPRVDLESDALEDLVHAAERGGMIAIVNAAAALSLNLEHAVPLAVAGLRRHACLVRYRNRYQTPAAQHLWSALLASVPKMPARWLRLADA